jgi:hypothetical protein
MKMTNDEMRHLAASAAHIATKYIQEKLNQPNIDFANQYFSNDRWVALVDILSDYVSAEIMEGIE